MSTHVSLRQMRYFVAVAEARSFRLAAERLHMTQPPLSRQVAELEAVLGVSLLRREVRGLELTAAGVQALQDFCTLLADAEAASARISALRDALPLLRVGWVSWLDTSRLRPIEQRLQSQKLVTAVENRSLLSHEAVAAVHAGRLEAAVVAAPIDTHGLPSTTLACLRLVALVPARSALARKRALSLCELNEVPPFYRFRRAVNPALYDHFDSQYRAHGFVPQHEAASGDLMSVLARVGAGEGCTCMPVPMAVHRYAGVVRRALREVVTMDLALVHAPRLPAAVESSKAATPSEVSTPGKSTTWRPGRSNFPTNISVLNMQLSDFA
jgi:LysR family transcriptional regulator, benzoate and cis,cis-muconate-responsive activator of ben and cat genes